MNSLDELPWKKRIKKEPIVVLTGAGISMSAGLPGGPDLSRAILEKLGEKIDRNLFIDINSIAQKTPLETIFQILADRIGIEPIQQIIAGIDGNASTSTHFALSSIAKSNQIKTIYTFNFDLLHEKAFNCKPIRVMKHGRAVHKTFLMTKGKPVSIWKLHGSCDSVGVITISEYIKGFSSTVRKAIQNDFKNSPWLILGYGGWDIDFQAVIHNAARNGIVPKEVIWVDMFFPKKGGRTDIINLWKTNGSLVHVMKYDLEVFVKDVLKEELNIVEPWHGKLSQLTYHIDSINHLESARIIAEAALNCGLPNVAKKILSSIPKNKSLRENAILAEKQGHRDRAARYYLKVSSNSDNIHTQTMSAVKAFILSKGQMDCFNKIDTSKLDEVGLEYFKAIATTKRTDTGGLHRNDSVNLINKLPSIEKLINSIETLDGAKYFFQILSELARIQHEAKESSKALELDQRAYRIVQGIADPSLVSMCVGNIGTCYMGLAENKKDKEQRKYLQKARQWLQEAVQSAYVVDLFSWALHSCNLGVVNFDLGNFKHGIDLLETSLPVLEKIYPNYAICFWGDLSKSYGILSSKIKGNKQTLLIKKAIKYLEIGVELSNQLNDWDDVTFLKKAAKELKKHNFLPENFSWLLS